MNKGLGIMNRTAFLVAGLFCICVLHGQEDLVERIDVLNREVVVRVFDRGEPVFGLKRKDFTLLDNGSPLRITSLREIRRALSPKMRSHQQDRQEATTQKHQGRLFLFLLWWNEESRDWPQTWQYFTTHIFRPGDRVILAVEHLVAPGEGHRQRIVARQAHIGGLEGQRQMLSMTMEVQMLTTLRIRMKLTMITKSRMMLSVLLTASG